MIDAMSSLNWLGIGACVLAGQIWLTIWFVALFAKPWARAYGVDDPKEHTRQIAPITYGIGAGCVFLVAVGLAALQRATGVSSMGEGILTGLMVAFTFAFATALPGYAFLKRYDAGWMAIGSQFTLVLILSAILAGWPAA